MNPMKPYHEVWACAAIITPGLCVMYKRVFTRTQYTESIKLVYEPIEDEL